MSTKFQSKSFRQTSINDKVVDRSGYDIKYDGEKAVFDSLKNEDLYRMEMNRDEFFDLMKHYFKSNRSKSQSIKDTLMNDFDIDKIGLVGDLFRDKEYTRSLMSPILTNDVDETHSDRANITKKHKRRRFNTRDMKHTAKKKRKKKRKV